MKKFIKKYKAKRQSVPFLIEDFWMASYLYFKSDRNKLVDGCSVLNISEECSTGDVVELLYDKEKELIHRYVVTRVIRASGNDHVVSPYSFDMEYVETITVSQFENQLEKEIKKPKGPPKVKLLRTW